MNRDEFEAMFTEASHSTMDWMAEHTKATAVIVALIIGFIAGAYFL